MRTYQNHISQLAPIEAFDATVFTPDETYSKQMCDFVLSLALGFNDLHDLLVAHDILNGVEPHDTTTPTPALGEFGGLGVHLFRLHVGTLHEILNVVAKNRAIATGPALAVLVATMTPEAQNAWASITRVATDDTADKSEFALFLRFARNKVAFHYDGKGISSGFYASFVSQPSRRPYVSNGYTLGRSRFYFADAAAQEYMHQKAAEVGAPDSLLDALRLMKDVAFSIHQLVFAFLAERRKKGNAAG